MLYDILNIIIEYAYGVFHWCGTQLRMA